MTGVKVALVTPPVAKASEVDPAVPVLVGFLRNKGVDAYPFDANLTFQEALLSSDCLEGYAASVAAKGNRAAATSAHRAAHDVARALKRLKSPSGYSDYNRYRGSIGELNEGFRLASRALGCHITTSDFTHPHLSPLSSGDLALVGREPEEIQTSAALKSVAEKLLEGDPAIVGISISYLSQALHAFALAGLLKKAGFSGTLLAGGGLVHSWRPRITPSSRIFEIFDGVVSGPGEEALLAVSRAGQIVDSPGMLSPRYSIWNRTHSKGCVSFSPWGNTLRWDDYISPAPILPLSASRGCYWAKCAFCPEAAGDRQPYVAADGDALAMEVLKLRDAVGVRYLHLTDNALSPAHMRRFAERFKGESVKWYGFSRLEKQLAERGYLKALAEGGCKMLQLGIESATPRLLKMMGKGNDLELTSTIVKKAAEAGIRVYGYFLFGLPTERYEEALATVEWIKDHADSLTFLNLSLMNLPGGGEMEVSPESYGLTEVREKDRRNDLSLYRDYSGAETLERRELRKLLGEARRDPVVRKLIKQTPQGFSANHGAFAPLISGGGS